MPPTTTPAVLAVTGAASGIGAATARLAAGRGHAVALLDRDADGLRRLARGLEDAGGTALALPCDVADERAGRRRVRDARRAAGPRPRPS